MLITTTNRELLREYKKLRDQFLRGNIDAIIVPQKNNVSLKISLAQQKNRSEMTPFENFLKKIKNKSMHLKRSEEDLF